MREHCLSEFNFHDPYMKQKQMENDHALGLLQERLTFLQDLPKVIRLFSSMFSYSSSAISQFTSSDWKYFSFPNWNIYLSLIGICVFL